MTNLKTFHGIDNEHWQVDRPKLSVTVIENDGTRQIVALGCTYLPLAIRVAEGRARERNWDVKEVRETIEEDWNCEYRLPRV